MKKINQEEGKYVFTALYLETISVFVSSIAFAVVFLHVWAGWSCPNSWGLMSLSGKIVKHFLSLMVMDQETDEVNVLMTPKYWEADHETLESCCRECCAHQLAEKYSSSLYKSCSSVATSPLADGHLAKPRLEGSEKMTLLPNLLVYNFFSVFHSTVL